MIAVSVLHAVEIQRDGERVPVRAGKTAEVLVRLALEAGALVRTDRLIEDLWTDAAIGTARNTLQTKVSRLRRSLGDPGLVTGTSVGYTLNVEPGAVDALEVLRLVDRASVFRGAGDPGSALETCTAALAMFDGEILSGGGDGDWIVPHRARLGDARLDLLEGHLGARIELGTPGDAVGELEALITDHPLREALWALLMIALYRGGRQADALAAFQRIRIALADDLGLDPGRELQQLERQILDQDPLLGLPDFAARGLNTLRPPGNLPSLPIDLIGRAGDIAAVAGLVATGRLVEILGAGGVGKTALAIATGRSLDATGGAHVGATWLARLEAARGPADVVDVLTSTLGVGSEDAMIERLKSEPALLILDNCEHVAATAGALAVRLLDAAPALRILCTSQVPLDVDGEVLYELSPLPPYDAVTLFDRRSMAQRQQRGSLPDRAAVRGLCLALDGLPLAIELAAARTKTLSVEEITTRLDRRFDVLSDPSGHRPERRRALRATIAWSYDLLFPDDQRGLWALATFAGSAPLPAVESVLAALDVPMSTAIDVLGRLASRSLLIVDEDAGGTIRYRLLDSIGAFALEALEDAGLTRLARAAHAEWYAKAAGTSTPGVRSGDQAEHVAFARGERANIDVALAWGCEHDPQLALDVAVGFGWAWIVLGDSRGAERLLSARAAVGDAAPAVQEASALLLAAWIEASTGHLDLATDHLAQVDDIATSAGDIDLQAQCAYYLAYVVSHRGEFRRALALTDRSVSLYEGCDRPWDLAATWLFAARAALSEGDPVRSEEACREVEHWLGQVQDPWLHVRGKTVLGELARTQHRFDDAVTHLRQASDTSRRLGFLQTEAYQLSSLGRAHAQAGDRLTAATTLQSAIERAETIGDVRLAALARIHLGRILRGLGRDDEARTALEAAASWHRAAGGGEQAALGECLLAAMDSADGDGGAPDRLLALLDGARTDDAAHVEVFALDALARIAATAGRATEARLLCQQADDRLVATSAFISEHDRVDAHWVRPRC
ncbi:winged helix-turn-helix domain-containing protein [Aquihabitans sp. G128]|uniref:AfsR/SARP family transcriptional regulator n=1 Tax=Aquihabitans sp. G128 TaxID=2849779 RepID=UPI001C232184|nr:BTAD domain-containing putative transcriptional regulator [Aquihabitans sp. G128]QXC60661.1 winged helix-turn-helix domain-containing protein [Aquihabitans sp. G128]